MNISQLSRTAVLTLISRVVAAEKGYASFCDPMAVLCLEMLMSTVSEEDRQWISKEKRIFGGTQRLHVRAGIKRVKYFDDAATRYIAEDPKCTVVNFGCGFDTRFWRLVNKNCRYVEIDLPEIVALKSEILKDHLAYELIGCSVLDDSWIDQITANGNSRFLILAEGVFPYLPKPDAIQLFRRLAQRFARSRLVFDAVPEKWTRGLWKWLIGLETKYSWGVDISWVFGIRHPSDVESYGPGLKVLASVKASGGPIVTVALND